MDVSLLDESALGLGDKVIHVWPKPESKHLGDDLGNGVDETNWTKI